MCQDKVEPVQWWRGGAVWPHVLGADALALPPLHALPLPLLPPSRPLPSPPPPPQHTHARTQVIKSIQNVLQTNVSVCSSLGQPFLVQFNIIFPEMLQVGICRPAGGGQGQGQGPP